MSFLFAVHPHSLALRISPCLLLLCSLSLARSNIDIPFRAEFSTIIYSQHSVQLEIFKLTITSNYDFYLLFSFDGGQTISLQLFLINPIINAGTHRGIELRRLIRWVLGTPSMSFNMSNKKHDEVEGKDMFSLEFLLNSQHLNSVYYACLNSNSLYLY